MSAAPSTAAGGATAAPPSPAQAIDFLTLLQHLKVGHPKDVLMSKATDCAGRNDCPCL